MILLPQLKSTMFKQLILLIIIFTAQQICAQTLRGDAGQFGNRSDQMKQKSVVDNREKPPITDYKIISHTQDTTFVDTTLSIAKFYKYNYLRKDNFDKRTYSNIGEGYTLLANKIKNNAISDIGMHAKQHPILGLEDVFYYHVPTPLTELYFKTTLEQGQSLDAFFTSNISKKLNFFIGYKGLRSLGRYKNNLTSQGSLRLGGSYTSDNKRYVLKTHFVSQDLSTQENGGLTSLAIEQYKSKSDEFDDRTLLAVNFQDAESKFYHKRFVLDQTYHLIATDKNAGAGALSLNHYFNFTDKEYNYFQQNAFDGFGASFTELKINNETEYQQLNNAFNLASNLKNIGYLKAGLEYSHLNYGYRRKVVLNAQTIPNNLKDDILQFKALYSNQFNQISLQANLVAKILGEYAGNILDAEAAYHFGKENKFGANLLIEKTSPDLQYHMFQSDYKAYNWRKDLDEVEQQKFTAFLQMPKWVNIEASFSRIKNLTYFEFSDSPQAISDSVVSVTQASSKTIYFDVKANKEIAMGSFKWDNTLLFQKVTQNEEGLNLPDYVFRSTLLYEDKWFKNALFLQTGLMLNYASQFYADAYNPIVGNYVVQNKWEIDVEPQVDFFFNAKIQQTRLFFQLENVLDAFTTNNAFVAPGLPSRDFSIRFGLVWNFFL